MAIVYFQLFIIGTILVAYLGAGHLRRSRSKPRQPAAICGWASSASLGYNGERGKLQCCPGLGMLRSARPATASRSAHLSRHSQLYC
jgi:hypothetical protein